MGKTQKQMKTKQLIKSVGGKPKKSWCEGQSSEKEGKYTEVSSTVTTAFFPQVIWQFTLWGMEAEQRGLA